jgi:molybdenum cofactor biosynthesis enzyme MoaA
MWSKHFSISEPQKPSLVVDVTYLCNAECRYCQWGNSETPGRISQSLKEILVPTETLTNLGIKRIVISGGEPRLHPEIESILHYYRNLVDEVVIMTNAYGLTTTEIKKLLDAGVTGFTVSLDSVDVVESFLTRSTPLHLHNKILSNLEDILKMPHDFEFGINSVISHVTANWNSVSALLEFGNKIGIDFIKFQPIFDDGFASINSPELLLSNEDVSSLLDIASKLDTINHPLTNPPAFWTDVAKIANGGSLPANKCGLGSHHSISIRGNLSMCFWVNSSSYGDSSKTMNENDLLKIQTTFEKEKQKCKVDYHCFCNQNIDHTWLK